VASGSSAGTPRSRLVGVGLFNAAPDQDPMLLGGRCSNCGEVVFPRVHDCPACLTYDSVKSHSIRGRGRLLRFVVAHRGPVGIAVPYIQAYIKLDDGPIIYSLIEGRGISEDAVEIGEVLEISIGPVRVVDGVEIIGWKFHPVVATAR
jgi:uncharacterized protein